MCWSLRVYWTVVHNLFARFFDNVANIVYINDICCCCYNCCGQQQSTPTDSESAEFTTAFVELDNGSISAETENRSAPNAHDYVIVDEIDADYLEIQRHKIETEPYYRTIDRATAEEMLMCREDGSCLVRPYKENDISIKYIVSVYAQKQYFHLFVRQLYDKDLYGIGQEKPHEKLFQTPSEIIDFHRCHPLLCTNKTHSLSLYLMPIVA